MKILNSNTGEDFVPVLQDHIFVYITDYRVTALLVEVIVAPGQHHWDWIVITTVSNISIDVSSLGDRFSSFDNALNKAVNDPYCTVYEFETFYDFAKEWESIEYVDNIKTVYKSKGYEQEVPDNA